MVALSMATKKVVSKSDDPYETNMYLFLRSGSPESADVRAANLINWINLDIEAIKRHPFWRPPMEPKPGLTYAPLDRCALPTAESAQRVVRLIEAFAAAGDKLKECLEKWPDRNFWQSPPPELMDAYRPVNRMLHNYRGEYAIDTHDNLRQPANDWILERAVKRGRLSRSTMKADIRNQRTLDPDPTAGLNLGFTLVARYPFGEQLAVLDLVKLIQDQKFNLLRKCKGVHARTRGDFKKGIEPDSCDRWFLAKRIDMIFCSDKCKGRVYDNKPKRKVRHLVDSKASYDRRISSRKGPLAKAKLARLSPVRRRDPA